MWFWSVSWSTNCSVFFSFFWSTKKKLSSLREFLVSLWEFLVHQKEIWLTKKNFGTPKRNLVDQKFPETDQKFPETGQFFFGRPKKNEKKTRQLVDQETDQNHMDVPSIPRLSSILLAVQRKKGFIKGIQPIFFSNLDKSVSSILSKQEARYLGKLDSKLACISSLNHIFRKIIDETSFLMLNELLL